MVLREPSPVFNRLLDRVVQMPVIDCHEHLRGPDRDLEVAPTEPIQALTVLYLISDLCWVNMIDPLYAQELLKRAVMTVPHSKIFGFGGDYWVAAEFVAAHLTLAREVIASALADLVESSWLEEEEATHIAADWLYNNPNRFYNLGLPPHEV